MIFAVGSQKTATVLHPSKNRYSSRRYLVLVPDAFGGRGGIAKFNRDLLTSLCTHPDTYEVIAFPRRIVDPIELLPNNLKYLAESSRGKFSFTIVTIGTAIKKLKYDLIICGHINLLPLAYILHHFSHAPLLLVLHGIEAWQPSGSRLINYLTRDVNGLISVSELTLNRFLHWAQPKQATTFILPNAVQLQGFAPGPKPQDLLDHYCLHGKTVLLTLGRLDYKERYKGFDEVIEVLPALVLDDPSLIYLIVGEGSDRARLEAKVKHLQIENHVLFSGFVPEHRKADYYRLADAFVMPSRGEGFGIVFLEAMACGIPVMGSKLDGSSEALMHGKLGMLVDPTNPEEVKAGIRAVLARPKQVPIGLDYFSYENFEQRCHRILEKILNH
jgi:phosphatidylinositol alpha-1,6-mannosyltransferase